jgi:hypothetical protein
MNPRRLLLAAAALACAACFETRLADPDKGGNSSETVARVGGTIVDADGNPVAGASVVLVPDAYNPIAAPALPAGLKAATDAKGEFAFTRVPKGRYGVEARHPSDGTRLLALGVDLQARQEALAADTLRRPGRVRVRLPDYLKRPGGFVYLPHTRFAWPVDGKALEHGYVDLDSLPSCGYAALAFAADTNLSVSDTLGRALDVLPGDTLSLGAFAGWARTVRISINTTASGAGISEPVAKFPMLVRLTSAELDFSRAAAEGSDLRFSKPDGAPLAYQIDHWDAGRREAAVWVVLDTVRADDSAQAFLMHYGKPEAVSLSDGQAVFGAAGYAAAWHLEEDAAGTGQAGLYRNSASASDHGTDSLGTSDRGGVIGNGHYFALGEYVRVPNASAALKPDGDFAISAWVKATATDSNGGEIASMGNDYGIRLEPNGEFYAFNFNYPKTDSTGYTLITGGQHLLDDDWHLVAAVHTGTHIDAYVDGAFVGGSDFPKGVRRYDGGPDFFIGRHGNGETPFDFEGYIDEVRVMRAQPSATWLKLAYASQRPGAAILRFSR